MKGQILFLRPREAADRAALTGFFAREEANFPESLWNDDGVLGKLAGEIVSHVAIRVTPERALQIHHVYVARGLRRMQVGRATMAELETLAARLGCHRLVVRNGCPEKEFFAKLGFSAVEGGFEKQLS